MKIYCASDLHIGYEGAHYPKIEEFFELVMDKADKLILCGDILDLWRCPIEKIKKEKKPKNAFNALQAVAEEVPTTYIWGNHDYQVEDKLKKKEFKIKAKITDDFVLDNIYYCHGWRFDVQQRFAHFLYGWLVTNFPYLYQIFFKSPYELKEEEEEYSELSKKIHKEAKDFIKKNQVDYLIMGHTHDPYGKGKLFDCGDMVDSLSYVIVENGKPRRERLSRK